VVAILVDIAVCGQTEALGGEPLRELAMVRETFANSFAHPRTIESAGRAQQESPPKAKTPGKVNGWQNYKNRDSGF
jgi:hypothetical protein